MAPPSIEQERHVLKSALVEAHRRLEQYRREGDELAADITESEMNTMIERLGEIGTGDTEDTDT